jgi:hypothetical protein
MTGVMDFLSTSVGSTVRGAESLLLKEWSQRLVQVSVYAGVVFYVLSTYELIGFVEKQLISIGLKVGKDGTRLLHAVIFAVFMYYGSRLILDPVVSRVEVKQAKQ